MPSRKIIFYNETDTDLVVQAKARGVVNDIESIAAGGHGSVTVKGSEWCPTVSLLQGNSRVVSHAECSSAISLRMPRHSTDEITPYDIFLSHSGKQKGLARDLYKVLSPFYRTFFDIRPHCLPAGEHFPSRIFNAAKTCRVAVVVLSEDFMCSKWAMLEFCCFIDNHIKILPLFHQLSPQDLKLEENLKRWKEVWEGHAKLTGKNPIDISQWGDAVSTIRSVNGIIYDESKGMLEYLDNIKSAILKLVAPAIRCDDEGICGKDRLCKVILDTFEDMERRAKPSKAFVLGLSGPPGSGKSTISLLLRDHFRSCCKRVLHLKLPSDMDFLCDEELVKVFKQLLHLTDFQNEISLDSISELKEVLHLLKEYKFPTQSVCLVVDNIHSQSIRAVQKILELGVGAGSKVILVAQSPHVFGSALRIQGNRYMFESVGMPGLAETEALELFLHRVAAGMDLDACAVQRDLTPRYREFALAIVRTCGIGSEDNVLYLPAAVEKVAEEVLQRHREDGNWEDGYLINGVGEKISEEVVAIDLKYTRLRCILDITLIAIYEETTSIIIKKRKSELTPKLLLALHEGWLSRAGHPRPRASAWGSASQYINALLQNAKNMGERSLQYINDRIQ